MTFKFDMGGFDEMGRRFEEASRAMAALEGDLTTATFDPNDQSSVESEIRRLYGVIDSRVAPYRSNPLVADLVAKMKSEYAQRIRARAADLRLEDLDR